MLIENARTKKWQKIKTTDLQEHVLSLIFFVEELSIETLWRTNKKIFERFRGFVRRKRI